MRISHEAIYQSLYVQGRGALRRELTACLRTGRALRVPRARTRGRGKGFISPQIMISERPPSLSTSDETLTIEESMTLRARTENAGHVGVEHEWSWSSG
jgi:IS30 family transposase